MGAEIVIAIGAFLKLALLVLGEIFAAKARSRAKDEAYEKQVKAFTDWVQKSIADYREVLGKENADIQSYEDYMDSLKRPKNPENHG
jgi:hypothetical protein